MSHELVRYSCIIQSDTIILYAPNTFEDYFICWHRNNRENKLFSLWNHTQDRQRNICVRVNITASALVHNQQSPLPQPKCRQLELKAFSSTSGIRNEKKNTCSPRNFINRQKLTPQFSKTVYAWMFWGHLEKTNPPVARSRQALVSTWFSDGLRSKATKIVNIISWNTLYMSNYSHSPRWSCSSRAAGRALSRITSWSLLKKLAIERNTATSICFTFLARTTFTGPVGATSQ